MVVLTVFHSSSSHPSGTQRHPIPLCLHPSAPSLQSPLNKTKYAHTSLLARNMCVNSHSPFPALSERNWLYGAVFFYYDLSGLRGTLHPQGWIARWTKSDKKGRLCAVSKTGKLNKNVAQMRLAGEKNKAMVIIVASVASTSQCEVYLRRAAIAIANATVHCQSFKTIGCTSFRQSSTKWDPIVTFIRQSATLVLHLL